MSDREKFRGFVKELVDENEAKYSEEVRHQKAADLHRQWLSFWWDSYSKEAHAGLAQAYVVDERFTEFYNRYQPGTAAFLRDAILIYTRTKA